MNKQQCEIALIILLISIMYFQSNTINRFSKSFLGKLASIAVMVWLTKKSRNAGIIAAFIVVVNLHNAYYNHQEGLKLQKKKKKKFKKQKAGRMDVERQLTQQAEQNSIASTGAHGGARFGAVQKPDSAI